MIELQKDEAADKSQKREKKEEIAHPSAVPSLSLLASFHPPTPPLPREAFSAGSDNSPPLMLACMKSLQASSAHPPWETLQEESSMSESILARLAFLFLPFVFLSSSFAPLPGGVTIN